MHQGIPWCHIAPHNFLSPVYQCFLTVEIIRNPAWCMKCYDRRDRVLIKTMWKWKQEWRKKTKRLKDESFWVLQRKKLSHQPLWMRRQTYTILDGHHLRISLMFILSRSHILLSEWMPCQWRSQTTLREGNVFTPVCQSFCSHGGRGGLHPLGRHALLDRHPF